MRIYVSSNEIFLFGTGKTFGISTDIFYTGTHLDDSLHIYHNIYTYHNIHI